MGICYAGAAQQPWVSGRLSSILRQPWQAWMAPVSMLQADQTTTGIMATRPYLIDGARQLYLFSCMPFGRQAAGLGCRRFVTDGYEDLDLSLAYAKKLSAHLSLGAGIGRQSQRFFDGARHSRWKAVFNTALRQPRWVAAVYARIEKDAFPSPALLYLDATAAADLDASLYVDFSLSWQSNAGIGGSGSFQYCYRNSWLLAFCVVARSFSVSYETGYIKNGWLIAVSGVQTPGIGWSPGVKLGFSFIRKRQV
ncbi:MAG: hypothetical protein QM664_08090 [Flavihumibacter sp.]